MAAWTSCLIEFTFHAGDSTGPQSETLIINATGTDKTSSAMPRYVSVKAQVQNPGQLVISPNKTQTLYAYPNQPSPRATFTIGNSADTERPLTIKTKGNFAAKGEGCDPIAPGGCCSITVSGGSGYSEGSLDVTTSIPTVQSVSVPLYVIPVNLH